MRCHLLLSFLLLAFCAEAQVKIAGRISYQKNKKVEALRYTEFITGSTETLSSCITDTGGLFSLAVNIDQPHWLMIQTDFYRAGLYVVPGNSYQVEMLQKDSASVETLGKQIEVGVKIFSPSPDPINDGIRNVNMVLDSFFNKNYDSFVLKAAKKEVDKFKPVLFNRFKNEHPIVRNYLKFAFAPIDAAVFRSREYMFNDYFSGPVQLNNREYMQYFNEFFVKHFSMLMTGRYEAEFSRALNVTRSFDDLSTVVLKADTMLKNDTLRKLVILKGLSEIYNVSGTNKQNIQTILEKVIHEKNKVYSPIASNILWSFTYLKEGTPAPWIEAVDLNGKDIDLKKFKGKYVYVFFWARWCDPCIQEMKVLASIGDKFRRKVAVIGVNIDDTDERLKEYVTKRKFEWITIYDREKNFRKAYQVKSLPQFFLIDKDGDILLSPAPLPSENIKGYFENLMREK